MPIQARISGGIKQYRRDEYGPWLDSRIAADSARTYDKYGHLRIGRTHISKANICPYYGREIPGGEALGLDPDRIYRLLRDPEELARAAHTFRGKPILFYQHALTTADDPQTDRFCGSVGSDVEFLDPYLDADVTIWRADAIAGIETETIREFSCAYGYVPIMTPGKYNGEQFDGKMTQIEGNHLCLVTSGRAGTDVIAADRQIERELMAHTKLGKALAVALTTSFPKVVIAQDSELDKMLSGAQGKSFDKAAAKRLVIAMDAEADEKKVDAVMDALCDVDDETEPKKGAKDCKECGAKDSKHAKDCKIGKDAKAAQDAAEEEEKKEKERKAEDSKAAMDALEAKLRQDFREADEAKRDVRPVVGDVIAQDSASDIYAFALDHLKVDRKGVEGVPALRALYKAASAKTAAQPVTPVAMDHASVTAQFPGLKRFRQA